MDSYGPITSLSVGFFPIPSYLVVSNIFYFHPYLGKIPNLTNIFQMGWNHQPAFNFLLPPKMFSGGSMASTIEDETQGLDLFERLVNLSWKKNRFQFFKDFQC